MFLRKKVNNEPNVYDRTYRELWTATHDAKEYIFLTVYNCLKKVIAITVYPEGEDKQYAIKSAETMKQKVIEAISTYERALDRLHKYWNENAVNLEECKTWNPDRYKQNAHDLVEFEVTRFYSQGR